MCDVFPTVDSCCMVFPVRIGMIFISVWAVVTGAFALSVIEQNSSEANFGTFMKIITPPFGMMSKNVTGAELSPFIATSISGVSALFMLLGVNLLIATLAGNPGFVQMFVWVTFVLILVCFFIIISIVYVCVVDESSCLLKDMDWLTGATVIVLVVVFLFGWIYLITVANSYVVNED